MNSTLAQLNLSRTHWYQLMRELSEAGGGIRESGAFLLGRRNPTVCQVFKWIHYGSLEPNSLHFDYIRLGPEAFTRLWSFCSDLQLEVVADIHTHPAGPHQSPSDKAHPMVAIPGHIALIAPNFAAGRVTPRDVSLNYFLGNGRWRSFLGTAAEARILLEDFP